MNKKLFVRNLSWSVTENELYDLFGEVDGVVSVKIPTRREDGKPRGFAFVEMATPEAAEAAIRRFNGAMLHNRDMVVDYQDESRASGGGGVASGVATRNSRLFVRNIAYSVTEEVLQSLFQQAGTVYSVKIAMDRDTGEPKGFGFVEMGSADEAEQAIATLNNALLDGKGIAIDYQDLNRAKKPPARNGGYGNGRGGYGGGNRGNYADRW